MNAPHSIFHRTTDMAPVEAAIQELFASLAPPPAFRGFLEQALEHARRMVAQGTARLPLHLPLAIGEALGARPSVSHRVAAACIFVWSGADLFDNVADDEVDAAWSDTGAARLSLGAVTLLAVAPHLVYERLADHGVSADIRHALSLTLGRALWQMSVGQFSDLASAHEVRTLAAYEVVLAGKSGAEVALFARTAALAAGRPPAEVERWHAFGQQLGVLAQWSSDIADVFGDPPGNDLRTGTRTAPILYTLHALQGTALDAFEAALAGARAGDGDAARRARDTMQTAGALRYALFKAGLLHRRARQHLEELLPQAPARARLDDLLDSLSPITREEPDHA